MRPNEHFFCCPISITNQVQILRFINSLNSKSIAFKGNMSLCISEEAEASHISVNNILCLFSSQKLEQNIYNIHKIVEVCYIILR